MVELRQGRSEKLVLISDKKSKRKSVILQKNSFYPSIPMFFMSFFLIFAFFRLTAHPKIAIQIASTEAVFMPPANSNHQNTTMQKTLSLLTIAALSLGTALSAATLTIKVVGYPQTPKHLFSYEAELYDTYTQGTVSFNENEDADIIIKAPFSLNEGLIIYDYQWEKMPDSSDLGLDITELVLDFTEINKSSHIPDWGSYLKERASYSDTMTNVDYLSFNFTLDYTDAGAAKFSLVDWYAALDSPIKITGLFKNGVEADGFLVTYTCDEAQTPGATPQGGIVFFSEDVIDKVRDAEIVPEPATATLSLLALTGLVARRRRK